MRGKHSLRASVTSELVLDDVRFMTGLRVEPVLVRRQELQAVLAEIFPEPLRHGQLMVWSKIRRSGKTLTDWCCTLHQAGRRIVPLPHPSGASLWLNRPENRALVDRALEHVRRYSEEVRG